MLFLLQPLLFVVGLNEQGFVIAASPNRATVPSSFAAGPNITPPSPEGTPINQWYIDDSRTVDTLRLIDRFAIRTNAFDWLILLPNIGVEFDVKGRNWNRWTVGISARYNWQTSHTFKPSNVYNILEVRLDGRQYWRTRDMSSVREKNTRHEHIYDRLFSIRRPKAKHPTTTYYRGAYVSYMDYSLKLGKREGTGRQGQAVVAGFTYGMLFPLIGMPNGNSLDLEIGGSAGFMYTRFHKYTYDVEDDCYPILAFEDWHLVKHPVISDLRVGLIYRLGNRPALTKYRYRWDVDENYANAINDSAYARKTRRQNTRDYKRTKDDLYRELWQIYDSLATQHRMQSIPAAAVAPKKRKEAPDAE